MTIFFDLDNTLSDDRYAVEKACSTLYKNLPNKKYYNYKSFLNMWFASLKKNYDAYIAGNISFQDQRRRRIRDVFNSSTLQMSDNECDILFQIYLTSYEENWRLYDDVKPVLNTLKEFPLGIITNGDQFQQTQKLEKLGLTKYFNTVIISGHVGFGKPHPRIFQVACKQANEIIQNCYFIGDNLESDAFASHQSGMHGIWLNRMELAAEIPSGIDMIYELRELLEIKGIKTTFHNK